MKGQISFEFLIIICISIAIVALFFPIFIKLFDSVHYYMDIYNAKNIFNEINKNVSVLDTLETGSYFTVKINPIYKYILACSDANFSFTVWHKSRTISLNKVFEINVDCNAIFEENAELKITKIDANNILFEKNNPK